MAETQDAAHAEDPPLPSRRELRRIAEEADARGEGPLPQDELLRRAVASRDAAGGTSPTGGLPADGGRQGSHPAPAPVGADPAGVPVGAQTTTGATGPTTAGIPIGHGFVTPPSRSGARADETQKQTEPTDDGEPKDYGKAGRNLPAAIGVGVVLGGSVLASLIFYPPSFLIIVLLGVCLAMWELAEALSRSGAHVSRIPVIVASACMVLATYVGGREALWVAFTAGAGAVLLFALLERRTGNAVKDVCLSLFALTYVGLMASLIVYLLTLPDGNLLVICFLAVVVASDIGGYIAGVLFGKHPIAPSISPKKSWEGYAGSALLSTAVGVGMAIWSFGAPMWTGIALGVLVPAFATLGDFSESMIKRDLELKDMGSLLPGHGGVMDRLDSILPTAPVALVLFSFLPGFVD